MKRQIFALAAVALCASATNLRRLEVPESSKPEDSASFAKTTDLSILEEALWDGYDVDAEVLLKAHVNTSIPAKPGALRFAAKLGQTFNKLQIAGMFDSGTNLLVASLKLNFGGSMMGGGVCPLSQTASLDEEVCQKWKHSAPSDMAASLTFNTLQVQMVRSPLSHLTSWDKAGYDLGSCATRLGVPCNVRGHSYPGGVTEVWNRYMQGYESAADNHDNVITVEYERLVLDPGSVMQEIGHLMGWSMDGPVKIVGAPAKDHGEPVGRAKAVEKLKTMSYLNQGYIASPANQRSACSELDSAMMHKHMIPLDNPRSYAADCSA